MRGPGDGRSLLPSTDDPEAATAGSIVLEAMREVQIHPSPFSLVGLRDQRQKLILTVQGRSEVRGAEWYDLGADPGEQARGAVPDNALLETLFSRIEGWGPPARKNCPCASCPISR